MLDIVWVSPQGHRSVSVSRHFLLQAPHCDRSVPVPCENGLAETTVVEGGRNVAFSPVCNMTAFIYIDGIDTVGLR